MPHIIKPAPSKVKLDSDLEGITKPWREHFDEVSRELGYAIRKKMNTRDYTGSQTLVFSDFGNIIRVTCNVESTITLPTVTSEYVDSWLTIVRVGSATIRIQAPSTMAIGNSGLGGAVICDETARADANLQIVAATTTLYVILAGTGVWKVVGQSFV